MLRISKTRVKELLAVTAVLSLALFINDVVFSKKEAIANPPVVVAKVEAPKEIAKPKKVVKKPSETECLAAVIYHEARGESLKGKMAVGQVVLNREKSKYFPDTVCKVVFQPKQFTGLRRVKYDKETFTIAKKVMHGAARWVTDATHFHTIDVEPSWALSPDMEPRGQIGKHLFYKMG